MFEKVNPMHPDKIADRIAGAIVDLAYKSAERPKIAVEVLIGHGKCDIIVETDLKRTYDDIIREIVKRISRQNLEVNIEWVEQDKILSSNQANSFRCGDNGIFKGVPIKQEERTLTNLAKYIYGLNKSDGKYIIDGDNITVCQSNCNSKTLLYSLEQRYPSFNFKINPLGDWEGGLDVDTGATNRKLGSDMGNSITGGGLCLSSDTEYLGEDFCWHKISEYKNGKVSQWNNGKLEFVYPNKYIHNNNSDFIRISNNTKLDMKLTKNHRVLLETSKGNLIKKDAIEIADKLTKKIGDSGSIIHNFNYKNISNFNPFTSDEDIVLQIAFCADGTIIKNQKWSGRIRVKKDYKKKRLRELLKSREYKETKDNEYSIFWFNPTIISKSLYDCFKNTNENCWNKLYEEIYNWDGDSKRKLFRTTNKQDADFVQFIIASKGKVATITKDNRIGQMKEKYICNSICYCVHELSSTKTRMRKNKNSFIKVEYLEKKEDSYCFNVPSHNLIVRYNNKIYVTSNCGKDLSKSDVSINIYAFLKAQETNEEVNLCCSIGDDTVDGKPYSEIVGIAKEYIDNLGGFEKFAEWGLIR